MKAHDWDTSADVDAMLTAVRGRVSDRKMVLFACGCCRLAEGSLPGMGMLANKLESGADRPLPREEKYSILSTLFELTMGDPVPTLRRYLGGNEQTPWLMALRGASLLRQLKSARPQLPAEEQIEAVAEPVLASPEQAAVLRELLGNPFRPTPFASRWRTETVLGLATAIDEEQAWDRMPILADALQDAGCEVAEILAHCRDGAQVHRRGCWVIDQILGRQ